MCEFCENAKIARCGYTQYTYASETKEVILTNFKRMLIKFEELKPLHNLDISMIEILFCPLCGRKLTETED